MIVRSETPVTLLGGAEIAPKALSEALALGPVLVAADGGADAALAAGLRPVAVIGDMDSLSEGAAAALADRLHRVAEQETTDFDKALRLIRAPLVLALGFSGGRFDHELAALHSLLVHADRPCLLIGRESLTCLCPPALALALPPGTVLSLFPLVEVSVGSEGLGWPTTGLRFAPGLRIGTSNVATGPVRLVPDAPGMLVILPREALPTTVAALAAAPRWPGQAD